MCPIEKSRHSAQYPFQYLIKWETSKKYTEFGEVLKEKWKAICEAISNEKEIELDNKKYKIGKNDVNVESEPVFHMDSAFDCVYFFVRSVPKYSPLVVVESIKRGVYPILNSQYPDMKDELINDNWSLIEKSKISLKDIAKREFPEMEYIHYYFRSWIKYNVKVFNEKIDGIDFKEIFNSALFEVVDSYNKKNQKPIDIVWTKIHPASVEFIVSSPIDLSVSKIAEIIKANTSRIIRTKHPSVNEVVSQKGFWNPAKFFAISKTPVKEFPEWKKDKYADLFNNWLTLKSNKNKVTKGRMLEQYMKDFFNLIDYFEIIENEDGKSNINLGYEEIDLAIKNNAEKRVIKDCGSIILVECKNWSYKVGNPEIQKFASKLRWEKINTGFMISVNGFKSKHDDLISRLARNNVFIVPITGEEIETWIKNILASYENTQRDRLSFKKYIERTLETFFEEKIALSLISLR